MNNLENQDLPATPLQGFTAIESFIRAFLRCDDHQLAILALWIANTWCFSRFLTIPYLEGNLEDRPWAKWGSNSRNHLSNLLRPFGIFSCDVKVDGASLKGYRLQDFQDAWERYAGPVAIGRDRENSDRDQLTLLN